MNDSQIHTKGIKCEECCCGQAEHEDCGGIIHCRMVDDDPDEGWIHNYKCDKCNEEWTSYGYDEYKIEWKKDSE